MRRRHHLPIALLAAGAVLLGALPAAAGPSRHKLARHGAAYAARSQNDNGSVPGFSPVGSTADFALALVSVRRGPSALRHAIRFLRRQVRKGNVTTAGELGKVAMAVAAAGRNPRAFGGHNLVRAIRRRQRPSGEYGNGSDGLGVIDHALAMLGLESTGAQPTARAGQWLARAECPDGGWQYDRPYRSSRDDRHCRAGSTDFTASDSNTTSYAVQALDAMSNPPALPYRPFAYLRSARDTHKHGWVYDRTQKCSRDRVRNCELTDTNSTSLVLQAYLAASRNLPAGGMKALRALRYRRLCGRAGGAFAYTWARSGGKLRRTPTRSEASRYGASNVGATIAAVPALAHEPLPLSPASVTKRLPAFHRC